MLVSPSVGNPEREWRWGRETALILVLVTIVFKHTQRMWDSLCETPVSGVGREMKFPHPVLPKMGRKKSFHFLWAGGAGGRGNTGREVLTIKTGSLCSQKDPCWRNLKILYSGRHTKTLKIALSRLRLLVGPWHTFFSATHWQPPLLMLLLTSSPSRIPWSLSFRVPLPCRESTMLAVTGDCSVPGGVGTPICNQKVFLFI